MIQMKVFSSTINSIGQVSVDEMEDSIDEAVEGHTSQGNIVVFFDDDYVSEEDVHLTNYEE